MDLNIKLHTTDNYFAANNLIVHLKTHFLP